MESIKEVKRRFFQRGWAIPKENRGFVLLGHELIGTPVIGNYPSEDSGSFCMSRNFALQAWDCQ